MHISQGEESMKLGKQRRKDWIISRWLWSEFLRYRMKFSLVALVFMILEAMSVGAISYLMRPLFDDLLVTGEQDQVIMIALAMGFLFVVRGLAHFLHRIIMNWQGQLATMEAQKRIMRHLYTMDQGFYKVHGPGNLISRVSADTAAVGGVLSELMVKLGRNGTTVIVLLAVAFWTEWLWTVIALICIPLIVIPVRLLQNLIRRRSRQVLETNAALTKRLDESFHGIRTVQLTGTEDREFQRFERLKKLYLRKSVQAVVAKSTIPLLLDVSAGIGMAMVLFFGAMQIISGTHTVGQLMSFFTALGLLVDPMRRLTVFAALWQAKLAALERTYDLLHLTPAVRTTTLTPVPVSNVKNMEIEFQNVEFSYGTDSVLKGISLHIPAGRTTAIVGPSGAGKTTLFSLMTRFFDPSAGFIILGDQDIRAFDLHELRSLFAVVSQETALFDESIRDNILMGRTDVPDLELQGALEAANVAEFLPMLPHGLDTPAGPRGSALSGGQRQRVIIARAILRNTPILLLDEATSALDSESEALVQQSLERLSQTRTTVVIAHRLSTVRRADQILVLERGRIIEQGTHKTLLKRNGLYARMCAKQFS